MRKLWQTSAIVVLALVLAPTALAGITDTPPTPSAAPEPVSHSVTGTIEPTSTSDQAASTTTDPVVALALNLLQDALSLF